MRNLLATTLAAGALLSANVGVALADSAGAIDLDIAAAIAAGALSGEGGGEADDATVPGLPVEGGGDAEDGGDATIPPAQAGRCGAGSDYDPGADLDQDCVSP